MVWHVSQCPKLMAVTLHSNYTNLIFSFFFSVTFQFIWLLLFFSYIFCYVSGYVIFFEGLGFQKSETYAQHLTLNDNSLWFPYKFTPQHPPQRADYAPSLYAMVINKNVNVNIPQTIPNTHTKQSEANQDVQISSHSGRRGRRPTKLSYRMM